MTAKFADTQYSPKPALGGWLTFPAIGTFVAPLSYVRDIVDWLAVYTEQAPPAVKGLTAIACIGDTTMIALWCYAAYTLLKRKPQYPKLFIWLVFSGILWQALMLSMVSAKFNIAIGPEDYGKLTAMTIAAVIWSAYMAKSQRVAQTFGWPPLRVATPEVLRMRKKGNRLGIFLMAAGIVTLVIGLVLNISHGDTGMAPMAIGGAMAVFGWPLARLWYWFAAA